MYYVKNIPAKNLILEGIDYSVDELKLFHPDDKDINKITEKELENL